MTLFTTPGSVMLRIPFKDLSTADEMRAMRLKCYVLLSCLIVITMAGLVAIVMADTCLPEEVTRAFSPGFSLMASVLTICAVIGIAGNFPVRYFFGELRPEHFEEVNRLAEVSKDARAIRDRVTELGRPMYGIDFSFMQDAAREDRHSGAMMDLKT